MKDHKSLLVAVSGTPIIAALFFRKVKEATRRQQISKSKPERNN
jgi:hypothetical protein